MNTYKNKNTKHKTHNKMYHDNKKCYGHKASIRGCTPGGKCRWSVAKYSTQKQTKMAMVSMAMVGS